MAIKSVQQIMRGTVTATEKQALSTLKAIKTAGFDVFGRYGLDKTWPSCVWHRQHRVREYSWK